MNTTTMNTTTMNTTTMNTTTTQQNETTSLLLWTALILMFFVIQAVIWTVAISSTAGDASHAVVAGYDEQSLNWDEVKRQHADSAALGWQTQISIESNGDIRGNRVVRVSLVDRLGQPIDNAIVQLDAFHCGRITEKQSLSLELANEEESKAGETNAAGVYIGSIVIQNSGLWQFNVSAKRGTDEFLFEQRHNLESNRNL